MSSDATRTEALDPAVLRAEWRLRLLEELAEISMDLARTLHRGALAPAEPADPAATEAAEVPARGPAAAASAPDPSEALARISRALRLTLALHARTDEQLRALIAGITAECEARRAAEGRRAHEKAARESDQRRSTVEALVCEAAEREIEDEETLNGVLEALEERLRQDEAYWDVDTTPLRETVERLCADLELSPDWSLWDGEGWGPQPMFWRPKFSVWAKPSRRPLGELEAASHPAAPLSPGVRRLE